MKTVFSWKLVDGECTPLSHSNLVNSDGISLLDCLLMDHGGMPYSETAPWLYEGLKRVEAVSRGEVKSGDWSRETWGVELSSDKARIYSLYKEDYSQTLTLEEFSRALLGWIAFLQSKPSTNKGID